jgi:hypothetical protein
MLAKQQLCLVTETDRTEVIIKPPVHNTCVKLIQDKRADFGKSCHLLNCSKPPVAAEDIIIKTKSKKKTTEQIVTIPMVEKDPRRPILMNPVGDTMICSSSIDGFVIRLSKNQYHPIVITDNLSARLVHTNQTNEYFERRFEIDKRRPFFYLTKGDSSWVLS